MTLKPLLLAGAALCALGTAAQADYSITILHTNDVHARFEPISKYDSGCSEESNAEGKCFGGYARLATAIATERAASNNSILVDGGDQFQGTLFYTYYKGQLAAEMMNKIGYAVMAVGNHEFNHGPENLRRFMDAVEFPVLMANADISKEPALNGVVPASTVIERGGEKLGFIGVTPEDNQDLSSPGKNITFLDPVPSIKAEIEKLEAEGVNKIILLSHSGHEVDLRIAEAVPELDLIIGGHSNTLLSNTQERAAGPYPTYVGSVPIVQAYAYGKFLGKLQVTFDDAGNVTEAVGEPILIDASVAEDAAIKARIAEAAIPLDEIRNKIVGTVGGDVEGDRAVCRIEECSMGNLVADAMLERVKDQGIDIAIANSGGIRASFDAGDVTMGEVLTVLPFQNTLSTFQITGQTLIDALENGVSQVEEVKGRFPQISGMKFTWDSTVAPGEGRIQDVMVMKDGAFVPVDPSATYGIVSNNFIRAGGDGYRMFREAMNAYDFGPDLADVLAEYVSANPGYKPYTDGRISKK